MHYRPLRLILPICLAVLTLLILAQPARAVPSFASQTGQPCTACHIGAFGPQLTAYGRAFKIGGYTLSGGEGLAAKIPLSAMVQTSWTHTATNLPRGTNPDFGDNNNFSMDQASLFIAGRINDYAGAFIQTTYDGVGKSFFLDNSDIRVTTPIDIGDTNFRVGMTFNNGPTVQDPFNSSMVWGPPYVGSPLAPTPSWEPILMGAFQGQVFGITAYAWYDNALYAEFGGYRTMDDKIAKTLGTYSGSPGSSPNIMPYGRLAYEWNWGGQSAVIGVIGLQSIVQPQEMVGVGTDTYTDFAVDGSYQYIGDGTHIVSVIGSFTHEYQDLGASYAQGLAGNSSNTLNEARATATYFYKNTYGGSLGFKTIWGSSDPVLYAPAPIFGSRTGSPNSTALIAEADYVPFGKDDSRWQPFANLKLGLQYTYYPEFNGASSNYDGSGRSASGNNTIYAFAWLAF